MLEELGLKPNSFFLVSAHREENIETDNFSLLVNCLNEIAKNLINQLSCQHIQELEKDRE